VAALQQVPRCEVGFSAELHDAFGNAVGVRGLFVGVHEELLGDRGRLDAVGREVMALVAQHAHQFGGERVVQQLDDVFAPWPVAGRHGAFVQAPARGVDGALVKHQALVGFRCVGGGSIGFHGGSFRGGLEVFCINVLTTSATSDVLSTAASTAVTDSSRHGFTSTSNAPVAAAAAMSLAGSLRA
jgi:hypothetical protein